MNYTPKLLPDLINAIIQTLNENAPLITELDSAIGDGDHLINVQRGLDFLQAQSAELAQASDWSIAWQKIGMTLMSKVGGASGSLLGTLFLSMSKAAQGQTLDLKSFSIVFMQGVNAVKLRGKADLGEKTMLDVFIPVAEELCTMANNSLALTEVFAKIPLTAMASVEATRDMLATKGRASFLGERSLGHLDAGAKSCQLMICAIIAVLNSGD